MTILNTGSTKKFAAGWETIFKGGKTKPASKPAKSSKPADKKKAAKKAKKK
jgi:hypothetical protein